MSFEHQKTFARIHQLMEDGDPFVVGTLLSTRGHAPQDPGAKIIINQNGLLDGTIGGGKLEGRVILEAQDLLLNQHSGPVLFDWNLQTDIGMSCGGSVLVLLESYFQTRWHIVLFGAGHVAQALCRTLQNLNCRITCVDPRPEWIERLPKSPKLQSYVIAEMAEFAAEIPENSFCVVVTKGHQTDFPILQILLQRSDLPFVGSIGSKVKARLMKADLARAGLSADEIARLHCPVGLELDTRLPEEIAISIAAQLLQKRNDSTNMRQQPRKSDPSVTKNHEGVAL